ncbi:MAG: polysaccharide biosynthesis/export family protein [Verrucomicrobiae bacterium]|nr:polysaccharide biosynthesis/export family protein [Verrucomicrobiae bacterium]
MKALVLAVVLSGAPLAAEEAAVPGNQAPAQPASWRSRYELGPGDVVNFSLYGRPELDRPAYRIAPDGTVSFLQAQNVNVNGLTIDEARRAIEQSLSAHYISPRVIVTPQEVASKRFSVLGKVVNRGVYTLERPITLVEAVSNAGGLETGLFEQNTVELADLDRSFVSRRGTRLPIDFRRLFQEGDMRQNVEIEPGDFIYVASNIANNYYVLGAVENQGVQGLTEDASVVAAISRRGGFSEKAWPDRVLVVRGSLDKPETIIVNVKKVLAGEEKDLKLQPRDIVFVADRPWALAEEILKVAMSAFVTSATSSWVNVQVDNSHD